MTKDGNIQYRDTTTVSQQPIFGNRTFDHLRDENGTSATTRANARSISNEGAQVATTPAQTVKDSVMDLTDPTNIYNESCWLASTQVQSRSVIEDAFNNRNKPDVTRQGTGQGRVQLIERGYLKTMATIVCSLCLISRLGRINTLRSLDGLNPSRGSLIRSTQNGQPLQWQHISRPYLPVMLMAFILLVVMVDGTSTSPMAVMDNSSRAVKLQPTIELTCQVHKHRLGDRNNKLEIKHIEVSGKRPPKVEAVHSKDPAFHNVLDICLNMPSKPKQQYDPMVKTGLLKGTPQEDPTAKAGKQTVLMGLVENVQRALNHARSMSPLNLFKCESSQIGKSENAVKRPAILKQDEIIDSLLSMACLKSGEGEQQISIKDDTAAPIAPPEGVIPNQKRPDYVKETHMESAVTHAAPYPNDQWTLE